MNKRIILKRIDQRISDAHESMEVGLDGDKYNRKVGAVAELRDFRSFIVDMSDEDAEDDELEDLPQ